MKCVVCLERQEQAQNAQSLCEPCMRSYERIDLNMYAVIEWAANRARRFERKRRKRDLGRTDRSG